ncbi:hypothetical protein MTO96_010656 [Rhipicephalus appendiculatus]
MSGYLGDLSERQQEALEKFRQSVKDVRKPSHTDAFLLRWLRARDFDVAKAESMYRKPIQLHEWRVELFSWNLTYQWRKENGVDDLLHSYKIPDEIKENFPGVVIHPCKDRRPIWIIPSCVDIKSLLAAISPAMVRRHIVYMLEYLESLKRSSSRELDKELETQYLVLDYDRFSLLQVYSLQVMRIVTDMLRTMEEHYPECLEKCISINAPYFFPIFWQLIRPFLSQRTVDKVEVYGREGWKERLLSIVDADSLPAIWGGNMTDPDGDPRCRHKVNYGGRFEEGFDREAHSLFCEDGVQRQTIRPPRQVGASGQRVRDVLEFDNTHSWLSSKTLAYMVDLRLPEEMSWQSDVL